MVMLVMVLVVGWLGGGILRSRSAGYESNNSVGTRVEYFSNIMAREPLSAPVIGVFVLPSLCFSKGNERLMVQYHSSVRKNKMLTSRCPYLSGFSFFMKAAMIFM